MRVLAAQTHTLEEKVSSLGWMAGSDSQTLKSMTRAQAHLMLAEYDLLDALEAGKKEENQWKKCPVWNHMTPPAWLYPVLNRLCERDLLDINYPMEATEE